MKITLKIKKIGKKLTRLRLKPSCDFVFMPGCTNQITSLCPPYGQRMKGDRCSLQACLRIDLQVFSSFPVSLALVLKLSSRNLPR